MVSVFYIFAQIDIHYFHNMSLVSKNPPVSTVVGVGYPAMQSQGMSSPSENSARRFEFCWLNLPDNGLPVYIDVGRLCEGRIYNGCTIECEYFLNVYWSLEDLLQERNVIYKYSIDPAHLRLQSPSMHLNLHVLAMHFSFLLQVHCQRM